MERDVVYVLLWLDEGEQRCAVYEDRELAENDAALVRGHVVERPVFAAERERTGRFER
jgi:hypothetical protein